ncbi:MAG: tripartite tricarboxylate transporter substrate binding protein [Betaproteobacteria bacterium]|nr:tripartite tricarboxylate transporter substrate binding protein [Betaproteobacteria bacterium]
MAIRPDARRRFVAGTLACAAAVALRVRDAFAQSPRGGTIRLAVGFAPGGASDRVARVLAPELARLAGSAAIVENIPGANGARAIARVSSSEPDGDTLLFASSAIAHPDNAAGASALRPVIVTSTTPMVLVVRASMPVHDAREFARYLSTRSGTTYGSAGVGNATHLCAAELVERLGVDATHVPYNGSTPALGDLMGGHIDFLTMGATPGLSQQAAVRMLAVSTRSRSRLPGLDGLPTIAETIAPDFDYSLWQAVFAPSRVPDAVVGKLNAQFREILSLDSVRTALADAGAEIVSGSPEDAERVLRAESERFRRRMPR